MWFAKFNDPSLWSAMIASWLPFIAFIVIFVFLRRYQRVSAVVSLSTITVSLFCSLYLLVRHWQMTTPIEFVGKWMISGSLSVPFGYLVDPTSIMMLTIVAAISFLVQVYSIGYMAGDPGFSRYYAFMSLFAWAMITLSLSSTMLQLYVFWELVGLSSYLLIGFWYEKFSASEAGKKAFVMTRLGDISFLLGLLLVLVNFGNLDILDMNRADVATRLSPSLITLSSLLIFGGIIGKSAQFPLLTWLPDAMEGPTPVSALLHSATMVAAGVFLFARLFPFFSHSTGAMTVFLTVGTISMLLASTMAMVSRDIKQVWAYSTISQLGFMIMGLAAGSYMAGVFHLTTHAGFKALLFLCSGVLIHSFNTNDMFDIGAKGGKSLKIPMITLCIAAAALSGLPPFSGFFSKELILHSLAELTNPFWITAGLLGAFLTAYYSFRLIFIILFPQHQILQNPIHNDSHHHSGSYLVMACPLIILAVITCVLGFAQNSFEHFIFQTGRLPTEHAKTHIPWLIYAELGSDLLGVFVAWMEFGRSGSKQVGFVEKIPFLEALFKERWYIDRFYRKFLDWFIYGTVSNICSKNDSVVIDGGIDKMSDGTVETGRVLSNLHLSMVKYKLMVIFAVIVLLAIYFFF